MTFDYTAYDAVGLAELVRKREVTPAELLEMAIARADALNPKLNAIVSRFDERARKRLKDEKLDGPFAGVPFLFKDFLMDYAGERSTYACKALLRADHRPDHNSILVDRFLAAGVVPFGHTNSPEFGFKALTESEALGAARNPWNLEHLPYGSSGGSAAAVAAGIVPMAAASDGGGSIRLPAAACGLFGLKPGRGLSPNGPDYAELMHGGATANVVSRSVRDSAVMLDAIQGTEQGGPYPAPAIPRPFAEEVKIAPGRLRIAFSVRSPIDEAVDPDCVTAVKNAAEMLAGLGHDVEEAEPAIDGNALANDFLSTYFANAAAAIAEVKRETGCGDEGFELDTLALASIGHAIRADEYLQVHGRWNTYSRALGEFFTRYDIYMTPTFAMPPPRVGEMATGALDRFGVRTMRALRLGGIVLRSGYVHRMARRHLKYTPFTQLSNLTGTPAMSLPLHRSAASGLPIGVQCVAAIGGEGLLLRLAAQVEQHRPWFDSYPDLMGAA
jgi:amidase